MDATQFAEFLKLQRDLIDRLVGNRTNNQNANTNDSEITRIIRNFRCDTFDPATSAETFVDCFEARCRMYGLDKHPTDEEYLKAKKELFLSSLKPEQYKEVKVTFADATEEFEKQKYEAIKAKFIRLYQVKTTRFKALTTFWNCVRGNHQTFEAYANRLKEISRDCGYDGSILDRQLRDRFATGVKHKRLEVELKQKWPDLKTMDGATEREVTFAEVFAVAQSREAAEKDCDIPSDSESVKHVAEKRGKNQRGKQIRELRHNQCKSCGHDEMHSWKMCRARDHICEACGKKGHYGSCCITKGRASITKSGPNCDRKPHRKFHRTNHITAANQSEHSDSDNENIFHLTKASRNKQIDVRINNRLCTMDWDPGASFSIISSKFWWSIGAPKLVKGPQLRAYGDYKLQPKGKCVVTVNLSGTTKQLPVVVLDKASPMLFGLPWCEAFGMQFPTAVCSVQQAPSNTVTSAKAHLSDSTAHERVLQTLLTKNSALFGSSREAIKDFQVNIHIKDNTNPIHIPARPIKFGIQRNVELEVNRLVKKGIISPVDPNTTPVEWATPTVNVPKKDGRIRICGDFRTTINPVLVKDAHPIPLFDQLRRQLAGGEKYSKIDLKDAYLQFQIAPASRKYLVISTHMGYFQYNRLPFGLANAPAIFQRYLEQLLANIPHTAVYFDDIAVTGANDAEHLQNLARVFDKLNAAGFSVQRSKCTFLTPTIEYLGHTISKTGIRPSESKLIAISNAATPKNKTVLRSFLGLVNFYGKFIPNLHGICTDLHSATKAKSKWRWSYLEQQAFDHVKGKLSQLHTLVPFDITKKLYLACDASEKGLGAVLFHKDVKGTELPIAFASRKLTASEEKYSVIDREAMAIFFAVKKFDQYLRGIQFTLLTDHKPLEYLLGRNRNLPKLVNNRLTRWALYVGQYDYEIKYRKGTFNTVADCLSRLPNNNEKPSKEEELICLINTLQHNEKYNDIQLSERLLAQATKQDKTLQQVMWKMNTNWHSSILKQELKPYYDKREELSRENGILMWQGRMVIPEKLRKKVLLHLHEGHPGVVAMRALARYYVWWSNIDKDIDNFVKNCRSCQENRPNLTELPVYSWSIPDRVWERLHIDFAGPFKDKTWLIVVDALSEWIEVKPMRTMTADNLCDALDEIFTTFGLPNMIVSDNGAQFTSKKFKDFCDQRAIRHVTATPYHPRTNGLAERVVRTFKSRMLASRYDQEGEKRQLRNLLSSYRNTPHGATGKPPSEMMFGRRTTVIFDNIRPNTQKELQYRNVKQQIEQSGGSIREFKHQQNVYCKTKLDQHWTPAKVIERTNKYSYVVETADGVRRRRHADQLRSRSNSNLQHYEGFPDGSVSNSGLRSNTDISSGISVESKSGKTSALSPSILETNKSPTPPQAAQHAPHMMVKEGCTQEAQLTPSKGNSEPILRRSLRQRKPPERLVL